jgi:hypothetical protein
MAKKFNITGLCFPDEHYMADVSKKMDATYKMVEEGDYFIINRPRQYGKTTTLYTMSDRLIKSGNYAVFNISFEGIGDTYFVDEQKFSSVLLSLFSDYAHESAPEIKDWLKETASKVNNFEGLSNFITEICAKTNKKVVLLIDEVDKSSNNQLFISLLGLLRNKYLERRRKPTFHSVVLAGVHDVKSLKLKLRQDEEKTLNSPWNIATTFKVDLNLNPSEIKAMLDDYAEEQSVVMDSQRIAEKLFYYTSGYPYLTSHLCKLIAEDILHNKETKEWTENDVFQSFQLLLQERNNSNFDTLIKNLREYPELYQLTFSIVVEGISYLYNENNATINLGVLHGIFAKSSEGKLMIHNRIYRELVSDMMVSEWRTKNAADPKNYLEGFDGINQYRLPNNALDMQQVMEKFQTFMRLQYSKKDHDFLERDGRLIFLAYLRPIINGAGHEFKEPQISEERRLDIVITFHQHQYVAELKIWHGQAAHEKGLLQLADYLDRLGLDTGYLLIFDNNKRKNWKKEWEEVNGKRIFSVRI